LAAGLLPAPGCDGNRPTPTSPAPPPPTASSSYVGDAVLTAYSGVADCGWGAPEPEQHDVAWTLHRRGDRVELSLGDDLDGYSFVGSLEGNRFVGKGSVNARAERCQLRELWLDAEFTPDLEAFEAGEAWYWGPTDDEEVMAWRWTGRRVDAP
jgi:hypothetical protein